MPNNGASWRSVKFVRQWAVTSRMRSSAVRRPPSAVRRPPSAVRRPRQRHPGKRATQLGDVDLSVVEAAAAAAVFRRECQVDQRPHRPVRAQQRFG
ncbi:hypothetical protein [Streptomyces sp. NPDC058086]|uniref:hypothetical protein n=1 Tax=Streptomyces sp. NPDC058086 TaxID=3346334 RepID=UPI0036F02731